MKIKRVNLQDIAEELGITKMTVSRYLKDPNLVSKPLGKKIGVLIEKYNYIPNKLPTLLSGNKTKIIGVLLPSLTNNVFAEVLRGIETVTDEFGYQTMLAHYGYNAIKEEQAVISLLSYNIDAIILSERTHTAKTKKLLHAAGIPIVEIMDSVSPALDMCIGFNNSLAAYDMTNQMIASGKSKIAYLGARQDERTQLKAQGYEKAMKEKGLSPLTLLSKASSGIKLGSEMLLELLRAHPSLEGVVCTNDDLAIGALFECQRRNISVPKEMAIAGFHGLEISQSMTPILASVITPRFKIGQYASKLVLDKLLQLNQLNSSCIDVGYTISRGQSI